MHTLQLKLIHEHGVDIVVSDIEIREERGGSELACFT